MQSSQDSSKWYQVSLRFQGDELAVEELEARLDINPSSVGIKGEYINGNPRYARYSTNVWVWNITKNSTVAFKTQIEGLLELLEPKKQALLEILSTPTVEGELFLGFSSSNGQGSAYFSPSLLARVSTLGLALNLDLYPPSD